MNYSIKPEEHELREALQVVKGALESCRHTLEKDENLSIHLGYAERSETGEFGAFGSAKSSESARILFNTSVDNWKQNLNDLTIDIYGQAWFYEKAESIEFVWQQVLAATTGLLLINRISEGREPNYNGLQEEWRQKKEELSEQLSLENRDSFSWQLKLILGKELLEDNELKDFPGLKRSDVLEAGDDAFL